MKIDIQEHELVPKHKLMSDSEIAEEFKDADYDVSDLPKISVNDPVLMEIIFKSDVDDYDSMLQFFRLTSFLSDQHLKDYLPSKEDKEMFRELYFKFFNNLLKFDVSDEDSAKEFLNLSNLVSNSIIGYLEDRNNIVDMESFDEKRIKAKEFLGDEILHDDFNIVLKITRESDTAGTFVTYRIVES